MSPVVFERRVLQLFCTVMMVLVASADDALPQTAPGRGQKTRRSGKLAPPPKWDRAVLEVFFPDARQKLGPSPAPGALPTESEMGDASAVPADAASPSSAAVAPGSGPWSAVIAASTLEDEVKAQVQPLAAAVQSPTTFKGGGYNAARENLSVLAVLFGVIDQYDGSVRWKKEAGGLRDLFGRAGYNCAVGTDNSFNEAKLRSQDLTDLIRGNSLEPREARGDVVWHDIARRPPLMKRMERSLRERLGPWTASKGDFTKNRNAVVHEAELLLVLARVIKADGYEYADDSSYRQYIDTLEQQCHEIIAAAKDADLPRVQSATSQMNKTCDACHADFRS